MKFKSIFLLLTAIAFTVSVAAKAPPGQECAQVSKKTVSPISHGYIYDVMLIDLNASLPLAVVIEDDAPAMLTRLDIPMAFISGEAPIVPADHGYIYLRYKSPLYDPPYVQRPDAFYARSTC